ncbi:hypothetical protein [Nitrospirillum sp. BR 11163]|uniref:hypothetical protein n=1 Tax=Nitrospirillum sp. BR 11163 TaxID=3104323 RepID=UPI002AFFCCFB|nr:hypothetical protein [Nitrospirillum sp. BR 11163]MEA1674064.1 hypothetical protein [Nitrospirillum sp. BR 11163]
MTTLTKEQLLFALRRQQVIAGRGDPKELSDLYGREVEAMRQAMEARYALGTPPFAVLMAMATLLGDAAQCMTGKPDIFLGHCINMVRESYAISEKIRNGQP